MIVKHVLSRPGIPNAEILVSKIISQGDVNTYKDLVTHVFSKPHSKDMKSTLRMMIEVENQEVVDLLKSQVFNQPFAQSPDYEVYRKAANYSTNEKRFDYLNKKLGFPDDIPSGSCASFVDQVVSATKELGEL